MEHLKQLLLGADRSKLRTMNPTYLFILSVYAGWQVLPKLLTEINPTVGLVDNGIWQLLFFSAVCYLVLLILSLLIIKWLIRALSLPSISAIVLQFKTLTSWQQIGLYWASFALLFLGALMSLNAIF